MSTEKTSSETGAVAPDDFSDPIAGEILRHVQARGPGKSICPSEVARAYAEQRRKPTDPPDLWRSYMNPVRQQAKALARQGHIAILRKGRAVDPHAPIKGVIRLALPQAEEVPEAGVPEAGVSEAGASEAAETPEGET
jgi:hypothetical protein